MSAYDDFITGMVELARGCIFTNRIRQSGHAERPNWQELELPADELARKDLLLSMTEEQRELIALLFEEVRIGAVHDVLADLEWRMSAAGVDISCQGNSFRTEVQETLHGDFIGRLMDNETEVHG